MNEEISVSGDFKIPIQPAFIDRELPGSRDMDTTHLIPVMYLSRAGKNRRKRHKRKLRRSALLHMTDLR